MTTIYQQTFEPVIGLEIHLQLKTKRKAFCLCANDYSVSPNSNTCPICLGYPGALPIPNREMVRMGILLGSALGCKINPEINFDRKNYFYPDLPKGYQITQQKSPLCEKGWMSLGVKEDLAISVRRIHLEEDAGKSYHTTKNVEVDFNRCGVPLLELVTEPDFRSTEEVSQFLKQVRLLVQYLQICDANMEKGELRCDANISLRAEGQLKKGTRVEIKNLNSIRNVQKALEYEIVRQENLLSVGNEVDQETRLWNEQKKCTESMRSKEKNADYRYFPEPDILPMEISEDTISTISKSLPELPLDRMRRYHYDFNLSENDAVFLASERRLAKFFDAVIHEKEIMNGNAKFNLIKPSIISK
ncbi:Asp-tRNA(Asn)/Glu-tRNA(Gln) amidotransferase subunit GatB, partial [bacterium]|nr:Asp-tRNA(Asn)/Glu-tRNA(Gln) amidotransferase subunit GatB [bacterium]